MLERFQRPLRLQFHFKKHDFRIGFVKHVVLHARFAEIGLPGAKLRSKGGQSFRFDLVVAGPFPTNEVAAGVARQLLEIGIEADVKPVSSSDLVQKYLLGRNYLAALVAIDVGSDPDQYTIWHSGLDPGTLNFAFTRGWGLIDKDLEDGRAAADQASRLAAYLDFQAQMVDAAPARHWRRGA